MWGNRPGWIISVLIALGMGWMLWTFGRVGQPTRQTGEFKHLAAKLELPAPPESIVPIFKSNRDAGDLYWKATQEYMSRKAEYDSYFAPKDKGKGRLANYATVEPAMKLLLEGASATEAKIFIRQPELLVNYQYPYPELEGLYTLGRIAGQIGLSHAAAGNFDEAETFYNAEFSLGKKLFDERINSTELTRGHGLLREATNYLSLLAAKRKDTERKAELDAYDKQLKSWYEQKVDRLMKVVLSIGENDIRRYAGDVFFLASKSPERVWRVEALLKVGRFKYQAGNNWDQIWAKRFLEDPALVGEPDPAQDPDPAVRAAAKVARELTIEGFNQIDLMD